MYELGANRYGKSRIRLVTVDRSMDRHEMRDLSVDVSLEGDFTAAHVDGDNANIVATDTMKNTVYAFAREHLTGPPEVLGLAVARHFAAYPQVDKAVITLRQHGWSRIPLASGVSPDAFTRSGDLTRVAIVAASAGGAKVEAGLEDLTVMKTTRSAFTGFERDAWTTLPEADDRIIWQNARENGLAIITKDEDFQALAIRQGSIPPQVVWVRLGNCRKAALLEAFGKLLPALRDVLDAGDPVVEIR